MALRFHASTNQKLTRGGHLGNSQRQIGSPTLPIGVLGAIPFGHNAKKIQLWLYHTTAFTQGCAGCPVLVMKPPDVLAKKVGMRGWCSCCRGLSWSRDLRLPLIPTLTSLQEKQRSPQLPIKPVGNLKRSEDHVTNSAPGNLSSVTSQYS